MQEPEAQPCIDRLDSDEPLCMSAATVTEVMIVALRRGIVDEVEALIDELGIEIVALSPAQSRRAWQAYRQWGKGCHAAKLNFGDCFAYALAMERGVPLLYVGDDFAQTDVTAA